MRWGTIEYPAIADVSRLTEPARGGHFAAFEQPELFTGEVRAFFRLVR
jgi:pimeloyl-ACP methyl ester carboxylesterase